MDPAQAVVKARAQRDVYKNLLLEVAELIGFEKSDRPSRQQLVDRLKTRISPWNAKFGVKSSSPASSSSSSTSTVAPPPKQSPPKPPAQVAATDAAHIERVKAEAKRKREELQKSVIAFDITYQRFGKAMAVTRWAQLRKVFPSHIQLQAGRHFYDSSNVSYRIIGYLPNCKQYSVCACPAWMLEDSTHVFQHTELTSFRAEFVVSKFEGKEGIAALNAQRVRQHGAKYGVFPGSFKLEMRGSMRTLRVNDINVNKRECPIGVVELPGSAQPNKEWWISPARLNEARRGTLSFVRTTSSAAPHESVEAPPAPAAAPVPPPAPAPSMNTDPFGESDGEEETVDDDGSGKRLKTEDARVYKPWVIPGLED